jgi:predicted AAA+ superfamily ATPase
VSTLIQRPLYLNTLIDWKDSEFIKIITGIRRSGKSTLFLLFQNYLKENGIKDNQIQNINFEDANFSHLLDWKTLHNHIQSNLVLDKKNYIFLDEVQNVSNFQKAVNSLRLKKNVDLYLTGSNSHILSGEFSTLLSGRYVEIKMLPLSFKEYVSVYPFNKTIHDKYTDYIHNSSFPASLEFIKEQQWNNSRIRLFLENIYNAVVLKDIVSRYNFKNIIRLENIIKFMFDNIGNETSIKRISDILKTEKISIQPRDVDAYIDAMLTSFILYKVDRYDVKGQQILKTNAKYYVADIGLRYYLLGKEGDQGHILENIAYLELLRRGYKTFIGKVDNREVDFVALKDGNAEYYQVAHCVENQDTLARELKSLSSIHDHNQKFILTTNAGGQSFNGIQLINVFDWLIK